MARRQAVGEEQAAREREHLREAVRRLIAGDSLRGIVTDWERRGIRSQFGNLWRNVNLRKTLLSPRLVGMRDHNGQLVRGDWDPIMAVGVGLVRGEARAGRAADLAS